MCPYITPKSLGFMDMLGVIWTPCVQITPIPGLYGHLKIILNSLFLQIYAIV